MTSDKMHKTQIRKGMTGLETAIILIAFIIVASAFAFTVLNLGFQSSQKAGQVIQRGTEEASSAFELDGAVIAYKNVTGNYVGNVTFVIKLSAGRQAIDLSTSKLTVAYWSTSKYVANAYTTNTSSTVLVKRLVGNSNNILEYGEKFQVTVPIASNGATVSDTSLGANSDFKVELKPALGSVLTVERYLPPALDTVMNLG
ncbi:MAG: hypothetical protein M1503_13260 [Thaumarchaeota archaeon]|nr:hypothetical protein [Nitrososphaerota archaeon]